MPSHLKMRRSLLCLPLALLVAGESIARKPVENKAPKRSRLSPALDLLPAGCTLTEVRIPRYDKEKRRAALVRAGILKVISEQQVRGDNIELRIFSKEEKESLRVHMGAAEYFRPTGVLKAEEVITVSGERLKARGAGGFFHLESRQAFVTGPVSTAFLRPKKKDPGKKDGPLKPLDPPDPPDPPLSSLAAHAPQFLEPQAFTRGERDEIEALLRSKSKSVLADRAPTRELMTRSQQLSQVAEVGLRSFTKLVNQRNLLTSVRSSEGLPRPALPDLLGKNAILVTCEGGMYIDAEKGHISYLRNIEIVEARFTLNCSSHLNVFFEKKDVNGEKQSASVEDFGDLKTIVASGGVRVVRNDPRKNRPPVVATAESAIVDVKTGDIVLQGGTPAIQQGPNALRAGEPDLYLRYYANGNVFAEKGRWTTVGDLASLQRAKDDRKKDKPVPASTPQNHKPEKAGGETGGTAVAKDRTIEGGEKSAKKDLAPRIITVTCTGGIYFDAKEGHIVYLEDVQITDPRFRMTAAEELKIFLLKKSTAGEEGLEGIEAWSDVGTIVASGKVRLFRNDESGKRAPITASADHVVINTKSGDMVLRGGTPSVRQGPNSLQADQPDLYLRVYENGSLFAQRGKWTTTGDLANLRTKRGAKKNPSRIIKASCKGGLYFDSFKGHIVYLDDIDVLEPRFRMSCAGNMRIHLARRENPETDRLEGPEAFSDVKAIVATGGVRVLRKDPRGKAAPVSAFADTATYDAKSGDIVLRGGYPSIRQGQSFLKAAEKGLYLRFYANGNFYAKQGNWINDLVGRDFKELQKFKEGQN